jgi:chemotaxis signal transduction protein
MKFERAYDRSRRGVQFITFRLGAEYYGIPVLKVREILRPLDLFPVPGMGKDVEGVINLRGEIIPVVKIMALLGLEVASNADAPRKGRMIIIDASRGSFGFFVDEVLEVTRVQKEEIQAPPDLGLRGAGADIITGIVQVSGRMVVCIDSEKLITDDLMAKELAIGR